MTSPINLELVWAESGGTTDPTESKYRLGWVSEIPTFQNFNHVLKALDSAKLSYAESDIYPWQERIAYKAGVRVLAGDKTFYCITDHNDFANTNPQDPELDNTNSYWISGTVFSSEANAFSNMTVQEGVKIDRLNQRNNKVLWSGNDLTLNNNSSIIALNTPTVTDDNYLLGNVNGKIVVVNVGSRVKPDGKTELLPRANLDGTPANTAFEVFHEGHRPTIQEVDGALETNPVDGFLYARRRNNWVKVAKTYVSKTAPTTNLFEGDTWYNEADSRLYIYVGSAWVDASPQPVISNPVYTYNTVKDMQDDHLNLPIGATIHTHGYYTAGDGGKATYLITNGNFWTHGDMLDIDTKSGYKVIAESDAIPDAAGKTFTLTATNNTLDKVRFWLNDAWEILPVGTTTNTMLPTTNVHKNYFQAYSNAAVGNIVDVTLTTPDIPSDADGFGSFKLSSNKVATLQPENGIVGTAQYGILNNGTDYKDNYNAMMVYCNKKKFAVSYSSNLKATNPVSKGHTVIQGNGKEHYQDNQAGRGLYVELHGVLQGNYTNITKENISSGGSLYVSYVAGTFDASLVDSVVRVVDNGLIDGQTGTFLSEMAVVTAVDAGGIYLDCILRHIDEYTLSGKVYLCDDSTVDVQGIVFKGTLPDDTVVTRNAAMTVGGAINPTVKVEFIREISTGLSMRGCFQPDVEVRAISLFYDYDLSQFGYGVASYGSCKGGLYKVQVHGGSTAYDDGIWAGDGRNDFDTGQSLDATVTGTGSATRGATWDTHPYSDGCTFYNCKAFEGFVNGKPLEGNTDNAFGYKVRGTNVSILDCQNARVNAVSYSPGFQANIRSTTVIELIEHDHSITGQDYRQTRISMYSNRTKYPMEVLVKNSVLNGGFSLQDEKHTSLITDPVRVSSTRMKYYGSEPSHNNLKEFDITYKDCTFEDLKQYRIGGSSNIRFINTTFMNSAKRHWLLWNSIVPYAGAKLTVIGVGVEWYSAPLNARIVDTSALTGAATVNYGDGCWQTVGGEAQPFYINFQGGGNADLSISTYVGPLDNQYNVGRMTAVTSEFNDKDSVINQYGKVVGKMTMNTFDSKPYFAVGTEPTSKWVNADGEAGYTPS